MRKIVLVVLFVVFIFLIILFILLFKSHKIITQNISIVSKSPVTLTPTKTGHMTITSSAFANNGIIPTKYTCDGKSINPPLSFEEVPTEAKSLVMLMDDPDAPSGTFDHWVVYNIPSTIHEIAKDSVPPGVSQGLNGSGQEKYTGPCPPNREHRYFFTLYALDTKLEFKDSSKVNKQAVIDKMQGHIIEHAELIGRYNRPKNK